MEKGKRIRYILCTLCFVCLALLDWVRGSQRGDYRLTAINLNGVFVAILMMSHLRWKGEPKRKYFIWTLLWLVCSVIGYPICCGDGGKIFPTQYGAAALSLWFVGCLGIRLWRDRGQVRKQKWGNPILWTIWLVMTVLMCCSRMGEIWPGWYAVIFGLFYLMPFSGTERSSLWSSLADGLILAFFGLQIWAYGFRPYDVVRYCGPYGDSITAALFYLVTYVALLYRSHTLRWQEQHMGIPVSGSRKIAKILLWLLAVGMWGFVLLTMTRTALLVMIGITLVYGIIEFCVIFPEGLGKLTLRGAAFLVGIVLMFPGVYLTVRYLPTVLHHPVWFEGEYSVNKVHSYDPADSDKYVSMEEVLENLLGRMGVSLGELFRGSAQEEYLLLASTEVTGQMLQDNAREEEYELLTGEDTLNSGKIRLSIWQLYLQNLNWHGHELEEGYFPITADYHSWHAQNVFLQIAFYHGIIPGILFIVLIIGLGIRALQLAVRKRHCEDILPLLVGILFVGFGMLEIVWYPGQTVLFLMYLLPKIMIDDRRGE